MARNYHKTTGNGKQMALWAENPIADDPDYLTKQLITHIGNKRALLGQIGIAVERVKQRLGKSKLRVADLFSGSGVVSRYLKAHASLLISNDIKDYAAVISRCYLRNRSTVDFRTLSETVSELNAKVADELFAPGFIEELYAPRDETNITREDGVFYTRENARRIDNYRRLIEQVPSEMKDPLLLREASVHANTAGVFKGFYKNRLTGVGQFGGSGSDALTRILGRIALEVPVLSLFECEYEVFQEDANALARKLRGLDLLTLPTISILTTLCLTSSSVTSALLILAASQESLRIGGALATTSKVKPCRCLLYSIDASFLLVSFNNEGFIPPETMRRTLNELGSVEVIELSYNAFRGSRNFNNRSIYVTEYLFLVERN